MATHVDSLQSVSDLVIPEGEVYFGDVGYLTEYRKQKRCSFFLNSNTLTEEQRRGVDRDIYGLSVGLISDGYLLIIVSCCHGVVYVVGKK